LFDMAEAPFVEKSVPTDTKDPEAITARKKLQAVLDQLNPAEGKQGVGGGKLKPKKALRNVGPQTTAPLEGKAARRQQMRQERQAERRAQRKGRVPYPPPAGTAPTTSSVSEKTP
jgi:hypothetical protein